MDGPPVPAHRDAVAVEDALRDLELEHTEGIEPGRECLDGGGAPDDVEDAGR